VNRGGEDSGGPCSAATEALSFRPRLVGDYSAGEESWCRDLPRGAELLPIFLFASPTRCTRLLLNTGATSSSNSESSSSERMMGPCTSPTPSSSKSSTACSSSEVSPSSSVVAFPRQVAGSDSDNDEKRSRRNTLRHGGGENREHLQRLIRRDTVVGALVSLSVMPLVVLVLHRDPTVPAEEGNASVVAPLLASPQQVHLHQHPL
jgi:hypothetical protein